MARGPTVIITTAEAARQLGVSLEWVGQHLEEGALAAHRWVPMIPKPTLAVCYEDRMHQDGDALELPKRKVSVKSGRACSKRPKASRKRSKK